MSCFKINTPQEHFILAILNVKVIIENGEKFSFPIKNRFIFLILHIKH